MSLRAARSFCILAAAFCLFLPAARAQSNPPGPLSLASLRLVQVVPSLPALHLYAVVENGNGDAVPLGNGQLSAMVGGKSLAVTAAPSPAPIGIVFLIDDSASLRPTQFDLVKDSILDWINALGPNDRAAIVTFGSSVQVRTGFTADKVSLIKIVSALQAHDQNTLLYQGVVDALNLSHQPGAGLPPRRAIVIATDGLDDQTGGAGRQNVTDALALDPVPIYGIGASAQNTPMVDAALKDFSALTYSSGGDFRRVTTLASLVRAFGEMRGITTATAELTADCTSCVSDGSSAVVRLFLTQPGVDLTSESVTVRMVAGPHPAATPAATAAATQTAPPKPVPRPWIVQQWNRLIASFQANPIPFGAGALFLLAIIVIAAIVATRRRAPALPEPAPAPAPVAAYGPTVTIGAFEVKQEITAGAQAQTENRRLRIFPVGRNDLPVFDVLFQAGLSIGRSPASEIAIPNDQQVSARHCVLTPDDSGFRIEDAGSRNGTRVNGVPITMPIHAESDSIIGVGRTELRIRVLAPGVQ